MCWLFNIKYFRGFTHELGNIVAFNYLGVLKCENSLFLPDQKNKEFCYFK